MANALITPTIIAREALFHLENNLVAARNVHREYRSEYTGKGKPGGTVNIRKPVMFEVTTGAAISVQDVQEANTSISVDTQKHVAWEFSTADLTLTVEEYSARYIEPACIALANDVDMDTLTLYDDVYSLVSADGSFTVPNSFDDMALAAIRMDDLAIPPSGNSDATMRRFIASPKVGWTMAGAQSALYNQGMVRSAFQKGTIGPIAGFKLMADQNVATHTVGAHGGTPLVNGAAQNVTYAASKNAWTQSLVTDGWSLSAAILKAGDVFTLANVFAVNPINKVSTGFLQQFVAVSDVSSNGSGQATITISPPIITSGPFQTVTAAPADNAAITVSGTASTNYREHLAFHRNAFALVTVPLAMPDDVVFKARIEKDGISIRVIKQYDISDDTEKIRLDILYGKKTIYPQLATRYRTVAT